MNTHQTGRVSLLKLSLGSIFMLLFTTQILTAQSQKQQYIEQHRHLALRVMENYKVPASICMAQAILETGSGKGQLATYANNHFGIKCKTGWTGLSYSLTDDDYDEFGNLIQSCFRKYNSVEESYMDYGAFLANRVRYDFLFQEFDITNYYEWANGLLEAGYATNTNYATSLIRIIEENDLMDLDKAFFQPASITFVEKYNAWSRAQGNDKAPKNEQLFEQNDELAILAEIIEMPAAVSPLDFEEEEEPIHAVLFRKSTPQQTSPVSKYKVAPIDLTKNLIR